MDAMGSNNMAQEINRRLGKRALVVVVVVVVVGVVVVVVLHQRLLPIGLAQVQGGTSIFPCSDNA